MKNQFVNLVESTNKTLNEMSSDVVSHITSDVGVGEQEVLYRMKELGIDVESAYISSEDLKKIYDSFEQDDKEKEKKYNAELENKHGNEKNIINGGDFTLKFVDSDEFFHLTKELRKSDIDFSSSINNFLNIVGAKLRRIEDMGKMKEFRDASFASYEAGHKAWRDSDYATNAMSDYRKGGVTVQNGVMTIDMNME